jgi:hypothetical protein
MALGRVERLQIMLTEDELAALDDWRFVRRMPSRAAAIREILRRGLAAEGFVLADKGVKSKDFGILAKPKSQASQAGPGRLANVTDDRAVSIRAAARRRDPM